MARPEVPRRILCIKLKHIGDVLLATPALRALRQAYPASAMAALVPRGTEEVLAGNPDLDQVLTFDRGAGAAGSWRALTAVRRFRPDLVLEMGQGDREAILGLLSGAGRRLGYAPRYSGRWRRVLLSQAIPWNGGQHVVQANLDLVRALGVEIRSARLVLHVEPAARGRMAEALGAAGVPADARLVVVHPVSRWLFKAWPEATCARVLTHLVREWGVVVALTSGPGAQEVAAARRILDRAAVPVVDLVGRTTLPELAAILERAQLFLGVDSAPMHMAAALGVPVVALFGPSGEHNWGPWGEGHAVVTSPFLCRPCGRDGCLGSKRSDCLEAIPAQAVLRAAEPILRRPALAGAGG